MKEKKQYEFAWHVISTAAAMDEVLHAAVE
jgi:hypothetical protein